MNVKTKYRYWKTVAPCTGFKLEAFTRPARVGKHDTPATLDDLTIGQLLSLSQQSGDSVVYMAAEYILQMTPKEVDNARAVDVVRFFGWVYGELQRMQKMFDALNDTPTAEEKRAGADSLNFGVFALVDWYALRMHITDHEEALKTPWGRVYKCLEMDTKKRRYEQKLMEIQNDEHKRQIARIGKGRR